jgi:ABC-type multidrug transport system permease subunit
VLDHTHDLPQETSASVPNHASPQPASRTSFLFYLLAFGLGLFSGWVNQVVDDALLTALCVLAFAMLMGVWRKRQPWRWVLLVWVGVPIVLAYYQFVVRWPHDRGQVYGAFLQLLAASSGGFGGHFMRDMIDHVFLKQDD